MTTSAISPGPAMRGLINAVIFSAIAWPLIVAVVWWGMR